MFNSPSPFSEADKSMVVNFFLKKNTSGKRPPAPRKPKGKPDRLFAGARGGGPAFGVAPVQL
jgi:hypothetical protein